MTDSLHRLHVAVLAARSGDGVFPRTAKLLGEGMPKMAKKLAEEAVEVGLEAVQGDRHRTVLESADLLYHLVVLWSEIGVAPDDVWREIERRERLYGIAEKLPKKGAARQAGLLAMEAASAALIAKSKGGGRLRPARTIRKNALTP